MTRIGLSLFLLIAVHVPASAACKDEVKSALEKLRKVSSFRMETTMPTYQGIIQMTVDYVLPHRMYQRSKVLATSEVIETILVDGKAWENAKGAGWKALDPRTTEELITQVKSSVVDPPTDIGEFTCLGSKTVDGKSASAYKLEDKDASKPGAAPASYRMMYVDLINGLPLQNVAVLPGREDKPFFKTVYSYPLDIKVDPPAVQ